MKYRRRCAKIAARRVCHFFVVHSLTNNQSDAVTILVHWSHTGCCSDHYTDDDYTDDDYTGDYTANNADVCAMG